MTIMSIVLVIWSFPSLANKRKALMSFCVLRSGGKVMLNLKSSKGVVQWGGRLPGDSNLSWEMVKC